MRLQKIHPDFDEAIGRVLMLDSHGVVVLFDDPQYSSWKHALKCRFEQTIPQSVLDRVVFVPWINDYADFISALAVADVILDPFHFGIGSTMVAALSAGTPIVTKPSKFLRGRVGLAICQMLEIAECVAEDTENYAKIAVHIATNRDFRSKVQQKIVANRDVIYENPQSIRELVDFLLSLPCSKLSK
jgi:predicted O-linked N-acetylglucosamine transferase (SPINDLY family)